MKLLVHFDRPEVFLDVMRERCPELEIHCCRSNGELPAALGRVRPDIFFVIKFERTTPYPREAVLACRSIKWVCVGGAGVDHLRPWEPAAFVLTNSPGMMSKSIAQYTLGAILAIAYRFPRFARRPHDLAWGAEQVDFLDGETVAVVGLGHTGRDTALLARRFGLRVVGVRAHPRPMRGVARVYGPEDLNAALAEGDFVVVAAPLTERTRHMIGPAAFAAMKPGAGLIDVSRGGVVDEATLNAALRSGRLAGAVKDVFEQEPLPMESPLWTAPNLLVTPHSAGAFAGWERNSAKLFADNYARWRAGRPMRFVVDPARGY